jgi:hypothetical protein
MLRRWQAQLSREAGKLRAGLTWCLLIGQTKLSPTRLGDHWQPEVHRSTGELAMLLGFWTSASRNRGPSGYVAHEDCN